MNTRLSHQLKFIQAIEQFIQPGTQISVTPTLIKLKHVHVNDFIFSEELATVRMKADDYGLRVSFS